MNRRAFFTLTSGSALAGLLPNEATSNTTGKPRIRVEKIRLDLKHAWTIARGTAEFKENVFVYYERDGLTGVGEAGHLTAAGQTAEQTMVGVNKLLPLYEQTDPFAFHELPEQAVKIPEATGPARAAIEMALMDWVGQKMGHPLYRLFGLNPQQAVPISFTIGLDKPEVMQQKTREAGEFKILKVKLGRENDEEIIKALRAVTDKPIRVDANEGWRDQETAIRRIEWLEKQNIELVEQPLPRHLIAENRWLKERTRLPILADESVNTTRDIPRLAGAFSGINIKLMKAGGLLESLRMFELARALGLDTMLGCMIESSVAISAAVHLQSLARWLDLDGSLLLKQDPYSGATFKDGQWQAPLGNGLGVKKRI